MVRLTARNNVQQQSGGGSNTLAAGVAVGVLGFLVRSSRGIPIPAEPAGCCVSYTEAYDHAECCHEYVLTRDPTDCALPSGWVGGQQTRFHDGLSCEQAEALAINAAPSKGDEPDEPGAALARRSGAWLSAQAGAEVLVAP